MGKCLVTGGAGFIGSHIVEGLLEHGDEVRVLDNFSTGKEENLKDFQGEIDLIKGDLCEQTDLLKAIQDIEYIFHQAAFVMEDPEGCFEVNVNGTIKLLSAAKESGVKRVVLASSAAVYGDNPAVPLAEDAQLDPLSPYAASKRVGEIYTKIYSKPVIYGDGEQSRDFIYIDDIVRANLLAAESIQAPGRILNICSGTEINLLQLVDNLSIIFNRAVQPGFERERPGDIYRSSGDPTLARDILEFKPQMDLETGLRKTVSWMESISHE